MIESILVPTQTINTASIEDQVAAISTKSEVQNVEQLSEAPVVTEAVKEISGPEEAAMRFTQLLPYVKKIALAAEGKRSLVRVMHALAEFPLGASVPRLLNDNERQLFQIMQELNGYKSTVLQEIIKNRVPPPAMEGTVNESSAQNQE